MNGKKTYRLGVLASVGMIVLIAGCETSSHKSVRTYEYSNEPQTKRSAQPVERVEESGDWEMTQPGEMVVTPDSRK